jgi:hypothetical protein
MNNTVEECRSAEEACLDYIISISVIGSLFIVSEVLPFLRGQNNGIADCLVKCFETSDCVLSQLIECLKKKKDDDDGNIEVNTTLTSRQEQDMKNEININIGETTIQKE